MMLFLMLSYKGGQCVILPPHRGYAYLPSGGLWCGGGVSQKGKIDVSDFSFIL
jgi:hypothetical protein